MKKHDELKEQIEILEAKKNQLDAVIWDVSNLLTNIINIDGLKDYELIAAIRVASASLMFVSDMVNKND
jgi:hypothetical protein